jgi:hypothetical protein
LLGLKDFFLKKQVFQGQLKNKLHTKTIIIPHKKYFGVVPLFRPDIANGTKMIIIAS